MKRGLIILWYRLAVTIKIDGEFKVPALTAKIVPGQLLGISKW